MFEKHYPRFSPSDSDVTNSHIAPVMGFTLTIYLFNHLPRVNQFDLMQII